MHVSMYKWTRTLVTLLILQFSSILIRQSASFSTKVDDLPDPSIKCGECPCVNPCSQQQPTPPPPPPLPMQYFSPPPPRFVYVTGPPGNLYPSDPFNLQIFSDAAYNSLKITTFLLVVVFSALQLLVFW
ncbi:hypothetical protein Pfo_008486 [Paulownia fortunei]|nr:hypothetical protein Pfo_008486 [Paulownia fortunei]